MSRFVYKVYHNEKLIRKFTSINHILNNIEFPHEIQQKIINEFKVPDFSRRKPQVFEEKSIGIKIVSDYIVLTGKRKYPFDS